MPITEAYNYRKISDQVATSGIPTEGQLAGLKEEGFTAVISLLPDESPNALPGEQEIVTGQGLEYHHIPVDFEDPTAEDYKGFVEALAQVGQQKVLIHCAANFRVSAFYSLYGMEQLGWTEEQADELIVSLWDPIAHPPWDQFIEEMREEL